ncbi:MAG: hypothetical protein Alpg2KO_27770 [Alphaproteobacteria bacterium]
MSILIKKIEHKRNGASLLSYGLVVGLIAVVALASVTSVGSSVNELFGEVDNSITGVSGSAGGAGGSAQAPAGSCTDDIGTFVDFAFTGASETHTLSWSGTYRLEVSGAAGGTATHNDNSITAAGGLGGSAVGERSFTENDVVTVFVGGAGVAARIGTGGFNGGGNTNVTTPVGANAKGNPGTGGGATDFRFPGSSLNDRIIVAGGGGGGSRESNDNSTDSNRIGGAGGGTTGQNGLVGDATGGTQSSGGATSSNGTPGSFGQGGTGAGNDAGGGGGGYYGGGGGGSNDSGAGGSGFIGSLSNASMQTGVNSGDGSARITLIACD